jgi:hypothetical protein
LGILGGAVFFCVLVLFLMLKLPEQNSVQAEITLLEENIKNIKALEINEKELREYHDVLKSAIDKEEKSYYTTEERDLTQLSLQMLALFERYQLHYTRLQKVDAKDGSYIEFSLDGALLNVLRFLDDIYSKPKYLNVTFFSFNNKNGFINTTIRMNYGESTEIHN